MDWEELKNLFGLVASHQFLVPLARANASYCLCRALEILKTPQNPHLLVHSPWNVEKEYIYYIPIK